MSHFFSQKWQAMPQEPYCFTHLGKGKGSIFFAAGLLLCLTGAPAQIALAKTSKTVIQEAKKHFKAGQQHLKMKRYGEAVLEFKEAFYLTGDSLVMGQVGIAYEKAGDYQQAIKAYRSYQPNLPTDERVGVENMIRELTRLVKEGKSTPLILPKNYSTNESVREHAQRAPQVSPTPIGTAESPHPAPTLGNLSSSTTQEKKLAPFSSANASPTVEVAESHSPSTGVELQTRRVYTWAALGFTGVFTSLATVFGVLAKSKYDDLYETCRPDNSCSNDEVDSVKQMAMTSDIFTGLAIAAGVTTVALFFIEGRSPVLVNTSASTAKPQKSPTSALTLSPALSPNSLGLDFGWSF